MNDESAFLFPNIDTAPGYKRVADLIESQILSGRIKPGDLLPIEGELAKQLGVHRSTVREGIRTLENAGLVKRVGAKRLMVSIPDNHQVAWTTSRAMGLRKVSFLNLWEVQMELEPFCADIAALRRSTEIAEAIQHNVEQLRQNLDDDQKVIALDIEFHRLVAEATQNPALVLTREPISIMLFSATLHLYERVPQARHRLLEAHVRICNAIMAQDAGTARMWMERHIKDFRRGYLVAGIDLEAPIEIKDQQIPS